MTLRKETWKITYLDPNEPTRFTLESFARYHNLPGPTRPENILSLTKLLISRGFADRGGYWSKKAIYKPRKKYPLPKPLVPRYPRIPRGVFTTLDLLELNSMRRYPENFAWAKEFLEKEPRVKRVPGSWRYVAIDKRTGKPPATYTGAWVLPLSGVFTTCQFQRENGIWNTFITPEQWQTALDFLAANGFRFDPKWRKWIRNP